MQLGFIALIVAGAVIGLICRRWLSPAAGRNVLAAGIAALVLGLLIVALTVLGWGPLATWTAGLTSVILLLVAAAMVPFSLAVTLGRR